ncbi:GDSL-type esterase/lipase family protein [Alkalinema pantanalense CENA528]|uniref:GDSL-type esterase/lipase family protein n=1 Tax=Alkalinema pantanalense TaxID=1620705 RepID=UPI003D6DD660
MHFLAPRDLRICFLGESFINGTGDPACLGWTGRICAMAQQSEHNLTNNNLTYYNLGIRRETSAELLQRWQSEVRLRLPEGCDGRLVFSFGTNDTAWDKGKTRVALADSVRYARSILTEAKQQYPVLMVSPPPISDQEHNDRTWAFIGQLQPLCQSLAIPFLDVFTPLQQYNPWLEEVRAFDGAHPRAQGYAYWAQLVANWPDWQSWWGEV